jgi:hypothetical protein
LLIDKPNVGLYYYIYQITNLVNGKIYIGMRRCQNDPDKDEYMGSSLHLKNSIKIYGKENFIKEIICYCDNEYELSEYEANFITQEFININKCLLYNISPGGRGGVGGLPRTIGMLKAAKENIKKAQKVAHSLPRTEKQMDNWRIVHSLPRTEKQMDNMKKARNISHRLPRTEKQMKTLYDNGKKTAHTRWHKDIDYKNCKICNKKEEL